MIDRIPETTDTAWFGIAGDLPPAAWLNEIRDLAAARDDLSAALDIWAVALIASLKVPGRKETAAAALGRLRKLSDKIEASSWS